MPLGGCHESDLLVVLLLFTKCYVLIAHYTLMDQLQLVGLQTHH